jgi:hypothetical protein
MSRCQCNDPNHFHPGEEAGHWLFPLINVPKATALNELRTGSAKFVFKPYENRTSVFPAELLEADDGELILFVPFTETVRDRNLLEQILKILASLPRIELTVLICGFKG